MKKRKASAPKRKPRAIDWRTRPAPKKGTPLRARYERSAVYKERAAAAEKAKRTRIRRAKEQAARAKREKRAEAGRKAWRTRAAKKNARNVLRTMKNLAATNATEEEWADVMGERDYGPPKQPWPEWQAVKDELLDATGDFDRYLEILDDLADDEGVDWDLAYGEVTD